jgi:segregation and condensation protein B
MELKAILESLIFASDKPLTLKQLKALTGSSKADAIEGALADIEAEFRLTGVQLAEVGGGYQFRTHPDCAPYVKRLLAGRPPRLTQAMLETLAIIAYRQPITRPEIEDIRGVDCGGVLRLLLERSLIRMLGKKEEVGRPILYGTTRQFLEFFNLKDLTQLPTLREFTELSEEMQAQLDPDEAALIENEPEPEKTEQAAAETSTSTSTSEGTEETWARAAAVSPDQEDEDQALDALDQAMGRVDEILRTQRREERERLKALVGEQADASAVQAAPQAAATDATPEAAAAVDAPPPVLPEPQEPIAPESEEPGA